MVDKLSIKFGKIHAQTIQKNGLDFFALIEQHRGGKLHGSVHREKSISDDLEARSCFSNHFLRTAGRHPGKLHLRESRNLGYSTQSESERVGVGDKTAPHTAVKRVVEKNFIHHQSQTVVTAESVECRGFHGRYIRAGWVVGMNENHGARPWGGRFVERIEVDLPAVIVEQRIRHEFNVSKIGEKLEQRITRLRYKNLVSGIAEQTEDIRISFAGAGGQKQALGVEIENLVRLAIVAAHGLARPEQTARLRFVMHRIRIRQRGEHDFRIGADASLGRVRHREIQNCLSRSARFFDRAGKSVRAEPPVCAVGEHKFQWRAHTYEANPYFRKNPNCSGAGSVFVVQY